MENTVCSTPDGTNHPQRRGQSEAGVWAAPRYGSGSLQLGQEGTQAIRGDVETIVHTPSFVPLTKGKLLVLFLLPNIGTMQTVLSAFSACNKGNDTQSRIIGMRGHGGLL